MTTPSMPAPVYDDVAVRNFTVMSVAWGIVGMAVSLVAMVAVTLLTPAPDAETQAMVDEVRTPTGPAILGPAH